MAIWNYKLTAVSCQTGCRAYDAKTVFVICSKALSKKICQRFLLKKNVKLCNGFFLRWHWKADILFNRAIVQFVFPKMTKTSKYKVLSLMASDKVVCFFYSIYATWAQKQEIIHYMVCSGVSFCCPSVLRWSLVVWFGLKLKKQSSFFPYVPDIFLRKRYLKTGKNFCKISPKNLQGLFESAINVK